MLISSSGFYLTVLIFSCLNPILNQFRDDDLKSPFSVNESMVQIVNLKLEVYERAHTGIGTIHLLLRVPGIFPKQILNLLRGLVSRKILRLVFSRFHSA